MFLFKLVFMGGKKEFGIKLIDNKRVISSGAIMPDITSASCLPFVAAKVESASISGFSIFLLIMLFSKK